MTSAELRSALLIHAVGTLDELATEAGVPLDEMGIARQLDAASRDLGDDTGNSAAAEALIEYHVLRRLRFALASRVDFDATAVRGKRSQIYQQVSDLLDDAASRAAAAGHPVIATPATPAGAQLLGIGLGYLDTAVEEWL